MMGGGEGGGGKNKKLMPSKKLQDTFSIKKK